MDDFLRELSLFAAVYYKALVKDLLEEIIKVLQYCNSSNASR